MPFFRGSQSKSPSNLPKYADNFPAPPPMFVEDDDVFTKSDASFDPPPPVDFGAKKVIRKASSKENGFRKLIRRHSSKIPREVRSSSPPDVTSSHVQNGVLKNGHSSVTSYDGALTMDKKSSPGTGTGTKVTFAATVQLDKRQNHHGKSAQKSSKQLRKSKSINCKMPLHSVLKSPQIPSSPPTDNLDPNQSREERIRKYLEERSHSAKENGLTSGELAANNGKHL